jgi:hypothetical protein
MQTLHVYPSKEQEKAVVAFLEALNVPFEKEAPMPAHVVRGIKKGLEDIASGRTITLDEFQARQSARK